MLFKSEYLNKNSIAGLGIDILNIQRIEFIYNKYGIKFCKKILGHDEYDEFLRRLNKNYIKSMRFLASRFSLKESFSKAIKIGMIYPLNWHNIQIVNTDYGAPVIKLDNQLHDWFYKKYGDIHISISDEKQLVITCVIIEKNNFVNIEN